MMDDPLRSWPHSPARIPPLPNWKRCVMVIHRQEIIAHRFGPWSWSFARAFFCSHQPSFSPCRMAGHVILNAGHIPPKLLGSATHSGHEALVAGRGPTQSGDGDTRPLAVSFHVDEKLIGVCHARHSANKHSELQVPIDPLMEGGDPCQQAAMKQSFRDALIRHVRETETGLTELSKGAGASLDTLKKLNTGKNTTTSAEQAMAAMVLKLRIVGRK